MLTMYLHSHSLPDFDSQFWAVETYVKQLGAWYFDLKDAVCANTEKVAREIKSIRMRKGFL